MSACSTSIEVRDTHWGVHWLRNGCQKFWAVCNDFGRVGFLYPILEKQAARDFAALRTRHKKAPHWLESRIYPVRNGVVITSAEAP